MLSAESSHSNPQRQRCSTLHRDSWVTPVPREQQLAAHPPRVVSVVRVTLLGGPEQQPEHAHDVAVDAKRDDVDEYATEKGKTLRHSEFPGDPSTQY
jgi:hypothetical protein